MAKIDWRGGALLAPVPPVLVSCGDMESSNIITVAWCGILNTVPPVTYISVRPQRFSHEIIKNSREFVINIPTAKLVRTVDFCGMYTGKKVDKFKKCNLRKEESVHCGCPIIAESPLSLECKVRDIYPIGSHDVFTADIVGVKVDESLIDKNGKLRLEQANLLAYAHGDYFELGRKLGWFGFSAAKKKKR